MGWHRLIALRSPHALRLRGRAGSGDSLSARRSHGRLWFDLQTLARFYQYIFKGQGATAAKRFPKARGHATTKPVSLMETHGDVIPSHKVSPYE